MSTNQFGSLFDPSQSAGKSREWCATNHRLRLMYGASAQKVQLRRLSELTDMVYAWEQAVAEEGITLQLVNRMELRQICRGNKALSAADIYSMADEELKLLAVEKACSGNASEYATLAQDELKHRRGGAVAGHHRRNFKRLSDEP